jgi:hypothetical protein
VGVFVETEVMLRYCSTGASSPTAGCSSASFLRAIVIAEVLVDSGGAFVVTGGGWFDTVVVFSETPTVCGVKLTSADGGGSGSRKLLLRIIKSVARAKTNNAEMYHRRRKMLLRGAVVLLADNNLCVFIMSLLLPEGSSITIGSAWFGVSRRMVKMVLFVQSSVTACVAKRHSVPQCPTINYAS